MILRLMFRHFLKEMSSCRGAVSELNVTGAAELDEAIPEQITMLTAGRLAGKLTFSENLGKPHWGYQREGK